MHVQYDNDARAVRASSPSNARVRRRVAPPKPPSLIRQALHRVGAQVRNDPVVVTRVHSVNVWVVKHDPAAEHGAAAVGGRRRHPTIIQPPVWLRLERCRRVDRWHVRFASGCGSHRRRRPLRSLPRVRPRGGETPNGRVAAQETELRGRGFRVEIAEEHRREEPRVAVRRAEDGGRHGGGEAAARGRPRVDGNHLRLPHGAVVELPVKVGGRYRHELGGCMHNGIDRRPALLGGGEGKGERLAAIDGTAVQVIRGLQPDGLGGSIHSGGGVKDGWGLPPSDRGSHAPGARGNAVASADTIGCRTAMALPMTRDGSPQNGLTAPYATGWKPRLSRSSWHWSYSRAPSRARHDSQEVTCRGAVDTGEERGGAADCGKWVTEHAGRHASRSTYCSAKTSG